MVLEVVLRLSKDDCAVTVSSSDYIVTLTGSLTAESARRNHCHNIYCLRVWMNFSFKDVHLF